MSTILSHSRRRRMNPTLDMLEERALLSTAVGHPGRGTAVHAEVLAAKRGCFRLIPRQNNREGRKDEGLGC